MYLATSLEVLMRRCADLSLALHDFSNAARYLKLCIHELFETMADRPYNVPYIAACQEAIAICHYFDGKLALPSAMPWSVGRSHPKVRSDSSVCRLELALNDYDSGKAPNYVIRTALLLYEYGRSRTPPCNAASKAIAEHLLRGGWLRQNKLYRALIYDTLASLSIFMNPPYPSNLPTPVTLPLDYSVETSVRTYVRRLIEGAGLYRECGASEASLRCYLRVQEVLRGVGQRGSWKYLYEHVLTTTADLYFALREDRKGLTILTACLVLGTPRYRSSEARRHLEYFMEQQQRALKLMGYGLCPHMPLPLIDRPSFTIDRNVYMTDSETGQAESLVGEVAAEEEWDCMEELTRKYYQTNVMKRYPAVTFPPYHSDHARLNYIFGGNRTNKTQRKALRVTKGNQ
ncbi:ER-Golgi trafficking TRAPP I complex 85 kDa subunit, putative [Angomonas deanei]|uniref:ER-Golgi trafficking TRAPP I complex 85 kDa subunit, putative n=1 Tax=Angomonas deanei TaxID=59799 RepID=A0A7G2CBZ9_9TRYP|nr:ER-Golgi trafficking TRAPP I complex 85 kDa subunit, putative [Angomonas deanei]